MGSLIKLRLATGADSCLVLDDNTYTNKTWAEVSGISVQEIHIMEVEFLSNMRYTLYVSDAEWKAWHVKLGRFWSYFEKASKRQLDAVTRSRRVQTPMLTMPLDLPSPPASTNTSPPFLPSHSFNNVAHPHPLVIPSNPPPAIPSPAGPMLEVDPRPSGRKRSHEDYLQEPPTKRPTSCVLGSGASSTTLTPSTVRGIPSNVPKLPVPNLSIPSTNQSSTHHGSPAQLPPPVSRPLSGTLSGLNRWPQTGHLPSVPQSSPFSVPPSGSFVGSTDWSRHSSYAPGSATPSPTSYHFPQSQHTPTHSSPMEFPPIRNSPYKPVRSVNTLLVPPPTASLHNIQQNLGYDQMRYQPLGKPVSERKTGIPPFMHQHSWAQPPPLPQYLPQPDFR